MKKIENFLSTGSTNWEPDRPFGNQLSRFGGFQLKFIIGAGSNLEHPILFLSYLPHLNSELNYVFFFFWIHYSSLNIF